MAAPRNLKNLLARLVEFPTVSADSNLALIDFIAGYLGDLGIAADVEPNAEGTKADLFATIGPMVEGGIVLSGHSDVVPVADQDWDGDPFAMTENAGRYWGRGTTDMKGFIATVLSLVPDFQKLDLKRPFHLAFSYDEELGCLGAPALIERLMDRVPAPEAAIIGEPTEMKVIHAHKGISVFTTTITGKPAHSSDPRAGANAVEAAGECVHFLGRLRAEFKSEGEEKARQGGLAADFDPPYTTLNVGFMAGGSAVNIIAARCRFQWECRGISGTDAFEAKRRLDEFVAAEILPRMLETAPEAAVVTEQDCAAPPLLPEPGSPAEALALMLTGENRAHAVPFATEAGLFQGAGIPAVVCGPGSVRQAHQPNEFIDITELDACAEFLRKLAAWAQAPADIP